MTPWTKKSAPSTTVWLEQHIKFRKRADFFYEGLHGFTGGLTLTKNATTFFFTLAGATTPGSYVIGRKINNFIQGLVR